MTRHDRARWGRTHRHRLAASVLGVTALLLAACSDDAPAVSPRGTVAPARVEPFRADSLPARAVLPLVPSETAVVTLTDFDAARRQLGVPELGPEDAAADRDAFWRRARTEVPLLTAGLLAPADAWLEARFGFGRDDVAWEAVARDDTGERLGWVLALRPGTDWAAVRRAAAAGAGPLRGAAVRAEDGLVLVGAVGEEVGSWAVRPELVALVAGLPGAASTYLEVGCRPDVEDLPDDPFALEPLSAYAVTFEGGLATAWLGEERTDLFVRTELGSRDPRFRAGFAGGVGDPATGRIGFRLTDPGAAARYVVRRGLPAAACAG